LHDVGGVDLGNRIADFHPSLLSSCRRDNRIERHGDRAECKVERRRLSGRDRHPTTHFCEAKPKDANLNRPGRHPTDRVLAGIIGLCTVGGPDDANLRSSNWFTRQRIGDTACDHALLGVCGGGCPEERGQRESVE
jgi:hypothetical protein